MLPTVFPNMHQFCVRQLYPFQSFFSAANISIIEKIEITRFHDPVNTWELNIKPVYLHPYNVDCLPDKKDSWKKHVIPGNNCTIKLDTLNNYTLN